MEEIDGFIRESKIRNNSLYCITVKNKQDFQLEETFIQDCMNYLEEKDGDLIAGFDVEDESIYFTFIDEWKIFKMINFFRKKGILIKSEKIINIIEFINSDKKYMMVYSDERNKSILNRYIRIHVTTDNILERVYDNKGVNDFSLFPIEEEILIQN